jgi:hypothetical protein
LNPSGGLWVDENTAQSSSASRPTDGAAGIAAVNVFGTINGLNRTLIVGD